MSPLDDQLRAALHGRADVLAPSPDPLAGIERRARGMKRRRVAASVAGAALAVVAIAVAVPSLGSGGKPTQYASGGPTSLAPASTLDPEHPWAFRGTTLTPGTAAHFQQEWASRHPGSRLSPLFAQVYAPSGQEEAAFVATGNGGPRFGWVTGSSFLHDETYGLPEPALQFALPGDEVPRLVVVAAPDSTSVEYAADGHTYRAMTSLAPGVGSTPLEGDTTAARVRVTASDGTVVYEADAAGSAAGSSAQPVNVAPWPTRGTPQHDLLPAARAAVAPSLQATAATVELKVLFAGRTTSGVRYVMGQAWKAGAASAHSFSYATGGTQGPDTFVGPETAKAPAVLAFALTNLPGTAGELLVVIPEPRTTQVLYDTDGAGAFQPRDTPGAEGVVLIDRAASPAGGGADRLQLLTGNGDPATDVTFEGTVASLLCGLSNCG
jgi:hypothetical protein